MVNGRPVDVIVFLFYFSVTLIVCPSVASCIEVKEVLVVVNKRMKSSVEIGEYYMKRRNIPEDHIVFLSTSTEEIVTRETFDSEIKSDIQRKITSLEENQYDSGANRISTLITIYGVPLKINTPLNIKNRSSVDSELALVRIADYDLSGWISNPYFLGNFAQQIKYSKNDVMLVSRLDGPDPETVYRIIDDTLESEKNGLQGKGYFDARGLVKNMEDARTKELGTGYKRYDYSIKVAAAKVQKRFKTVLDDKQPLFPENSCPEAALYCGWYSLANYVDSFNWVQGAIGYHIASAECSTLRNPSSSVWCLRMLQKGVAASVGPVYEPYVQGFPLPEIFFEKLVEGYMSLGEAYLVSLPFISWQMVLIGDPLYQPFAPIELIE